MFLSVSMIPLNFSHVWLQFMSETGWVGRLLDRAKGDGM